MKKIFCSLSFFVLVFETLAQNSNDAGMVQLKGLNAKFINNFVTNDSAEHSKIIDKDFVCRIT